MRKTLVAFSLLTATLLSVRVAGQESPDELPALGWLSAVEALNEDAEHLRPRLRQTLKTQTDLFRQKLSAGGEPGRQEGQVPVSKLCTASMGGGAPFFAPPDGRNFGSALLLAEVAVVATVKDIIPGFGVFDWPHVLLALDDAVPLHTSSPLPDYALVPVERMVVGDHVFCGDFGLGFDPLVGARLVLIGPWYRGTVPVGPGPGASSLLGVMGADGQSLHWKSSMGSVPKNLADLQARVDEAVSGNLFSLTENLIRLKEGSKERREFGRGWSRRAREGCRLISAKNDGATLTRICIDPKASAEERERFDRAWTQQCLGDGPPLSGQILSDGSWTSTTLCER